MPSSSQVTAGSDILAASYNNLRKDIIESSLIYAATSTGSDAYAITLDAQYTAYVTGSIFLFKTDVANIGAATLNINGLGAKSIKKQHDLDLETGDIEAGHAILIAYDGTNFQMLNPNAVSLTSAEVIQLNGISADVTDTNLNTLTAGATSNSSDLHCHPLDSGDYKFGADSWDVTAGGQTKTVTHNLGSTPSLIKMHYMGQGTTGFGNVEGHSIYDGSAYACLYRVFTGATATRESLTTSSYILVCCAGGYSGCYWKATVTTNGVNSFTMTSANYFGSGLVNFIWQVFR